MGLLLCGKEGLGRESGKARPPRPSPVFLLFGQGLEVEPLHEDALDAAVLEAAEVQRPLRGSLRASRRVASQQGHHGLHLAQLVEHVVGVEDPLREARDLWIDAARPADPVLTAPVT